MNSLKELLKSKKMYVGLVVGILIALAYRRFFGPVAGIANALPGSDAKVAAKAA